MLPDLSHPIIQNFLIIGGASLIPIALVSLTSFTRFVIVLSLMRTALGLQQTPPNVVIISLAFFMSLFSMSPLYVDINEGPYKAYQAGNISSEEFYTDAYNSVESFLVSKTEHVDYEFVQSLRKTPVASDAQGDIDFFVLAPAFMLSELKAAFQFAFVIFIPFVLIDLVVASILMALGMIMLPPISISLPIKLLVFVLVDGWSLLIGGLVNSF